VCGKKSGMRGPHVVNPDLTCPPAEFCIGDSGCEDEAEDRGYLGRDRLQGKSSSKDGPK
jgi:hypothetical protein